MTDTRSACSTSHLNRLEDVGLKEVVERDREGLERGQPYRFFRLAKAARELFDRNNLFDPEVYQAWFTDVEKTGEIEAAKAVERPSDDSCLLVRSNSDEQGGSTQ